MDKDKVLNYVEDNWHLMLCVVAVVLAGMNFFIPAGVVLAVFLFVDFASTERLRNKVASMTKNFKINTRHVLIDALEEASDLPEKAGKVLINMGTKIGEIADNLEKR